MNKKLLIIIIAAVVLLGGAAAAYFLLFAGDKEEVVVSSTYTPGEFFVTNASDAMNMVKVTLVLKVNVAADDEEAHNFLTENNHIIRDAVVLTLRSKTYAELTSQDIKSLLEPELVQRINANLGMEIVTGIYFNDYVVQ